MATEQKGADGVTDLLVAHQVTLRVGRAQEHSEYVLAIELVLSAPLGNLFHHNCVDRGDRAVHSREGPVPSVLAARRDHRLNEEALRVALAKQRVGCRAQPLDARGLGDPEHRRHHHLEGDLLDMWLSRGRATEGPARESLLGLALHGLVVAGESASVERRELHLSHAHVLGAVEVRESRWTGMRWCADALASAAPRRSTFVSAVKTSLMSSGSVRHSHGPLSLASGPRSGHRGVDNCARSARGRASTQQR